MTREHSSPFVWFMTLGGIVVLFCIVVYAVFNGLYTAKDNYTELKIELVADELGLDTSDVVIDNDGQTFSTQDGDYKANFTEVKNELELRTLVKLKDGGKLD